MTRLRSTSLGIIAAALVTSATLLSSARQIVTAPVTIQSTTPIPGFADSLQLIGDLLDRGRGIEAENVARALLTRVESLRGRDALEVAEVLDLLGRAVRRSPKVSNEDKRVIAERAVAIKERALGPVDPRLATSLINLGVQLALSGEPASARPLLERALNILEGAFGRDHLTVAAALQSLGGLLITLHDDAGAKLLLERAQLIRETAYGTDHPDTLRTLVNLAILFQETGDYSGARERYARAYERASALAAQVRVPADPLTLQVLTGLPVVLSDLGGDSASSATLNQRLLVLIERTFGPADRRLMTPLQNLAMDLRDLGRYAEAKTVAERSLTMTEGAFGSRHPEVASSLHTLATIVAAMGDYAEAMRLFERATRINEEVLRPSNPERARASWFIRDLLPLSGYGSEDADLFERVLANRDSTRGLADPRTAESLSNLAAVLFSADDYRRTRPLFERALEAQERLLGPDHPEVAASATNLAQVLSRTDEHEAAKALYERALDIWEKALGPEHPKVATALVNLARLYMKTGNSAQAVPLLDRALSIQQDALGPVHPDIAVTLSVRADLSARSGATVEAFATAARVEALSREHLQLTVRTLPERQALAYASSLPSDLDLMLTVVSTRPRDSQMLTETWDAVIQRRGIVLDEMAARHSPTGSDTAENGALIDALGSARQRLATLVVRGIRNDAPDRYRRLLESARADKDRAERALAEKSAHFRDDLSRTRIGAADVTAALPPRSALVSFVRYQSQDLNKADASYLAFVLRAGSSEPVLVPIGSAARVDGLIVQWRKQLDQEALSSVRTPNRGEAAYRRVAGELRQLVWDPLVAHVGNATHVFVVPDGSLHLVSFAALPTGASQYLIDAGPVIHHLPAERDLVLPQSDMPRGQGLLAVGSPAFDGMTPSSAASQASFRGTRSVCPEFQSLNFDPLPASLKEVNEVVTLWQAYETRERTASAVAMPSPSRATVLTGSTASESAFKTEAAGRRILHLATHGFFLGARCASALGPVGSSTLLETSTRIARENPLLSSGLILAGANLRNIAAPGQDDGVLTAEEVAAMNLHGVEWAVLSGCDTGGGEVRAGEGVFGLRRAFQLAGARTVIMSLWAVEDDATRQWMTALYSGRLLKRLSTADAVHEASRAMLRARRSQGLTTHPFHWAGFVAAGDWR